MDELKVLQELFKSNGVILRDKSRNEVTPEKFRRICSDKDILFKTEETYIKYAEAVQALVNNDLEKNALDIVREKITKEMVFEGFVAKGAIGQDSLVWYSGNGGHWLGGVKDLNPRTVHEIMKNQAYHEVVTKWKNLLTPYASALKLNVGNVKEVIEMMWEKLYSAEHDMAQQTVDFSAPPALLEGFSTTSEYIIPFTKKHSTLNELNPILKDFLTRTEDHKYLCAILASRLIGHSKAYIPWITGKGGDGKSAFITFLRMIVGKYSCVIDISSDQANISEAIGKTLIIVNDTSKKNIFHYDLIKNVSGGDGISINAKYKHPVTLVLPGQIIITSNSTPNIGRYPYAQRRARVFKVSEGNFSETIKEVSVKVAAEAMFSTVNEFLNYSLQCLEELGSIETGYVPRPLSSKTHEKKTLEEHSYYDFIENNKLALGPNSTISGVLLRKLLNKEKKERGEFFPDNFLEYMHKYCGVTSEEKHYVGIGSNTLVGEKAEKIEKLSQQLQGALPNDH
jgi:hypothetical protein